MRIIYHFRLSCLIQNTYQNGTSDKSSAPSTAGLSLSSVATIATAPAINLPLGPFLTQPDKVNSIPTYQKSIDILGFKHTISLEDGSGYTKRLGAGGAIAGGLSGAALGSLMAIPSVRNVVASKLGGGLISRGIKNMKGVAAPMASVGAGGAAIGAYQGSDEGMQMDFIRNLSREQKEKILRRQMMEGA